jgi:hypothetical protein
VHEHVNGVFDQPQPATQRRLFPEERETMTHISMMLATAS